MHTAHRLGAFFAQDAYTPGNLQKAILRIKNSELEKVTPLTCDHFRVSIINFKGVFQLLGAAKTEGCGF